MRNPYPEGVATLRLRRYCLSQVFWINFLDLSAKGCAFRFKADWPEGVTFRNFYYDLQTDCHWLVVQHEIFRELDEGEMIPEGGPIHCEAIP